MIKISGNIIFLPVIITAVFFISCKQRSAPAGTVLFEVLDEHKTNLHFSNDLKPTPEFNMLKYMYYYNGAGVGAGDFNNDGRIDLFFASNQGHNSLYMNEGNMKFKDVTAAAQIPVDSSWSNGVSVVDINSDGVACSKKSSSHLFCPEKV